MAGIPSIDVRGTLRKLFPDAWLRRLAYDCGVVRRRRKVDPVALFCTLVLRYRSMGFGALRYLRAGAHARRAST